MLLIGTPFAPRSEDVEMIDDFRGITVLIADDVYSIRSMVRNMLRQIGFKSFLDAKDGAEAIHTITKDDIGLILCDWNMPKVSGLEVLQFIRSEPAYKSLPFIMVTAEIAAPAVAEAAEGEVDDYVVKPFTLVQLRSKIFKVLSKQKEQSAVDKFLEQGKQCLLEKNFKEAEKAFNLALEINEMSPRTLLELGKLYENQGHNEKAIEYHQQAIKLAPQFIKAQESIAYLYRNLGNKQKYVDHLQRAVHISPRNMERKFSLGNAFVEVGKKNEATKLYQQVLDESSKQYSEIAGRVGEAFLRLGAYELAEQAFKKALETDPKSLHLFNQLGIAHRKLEKYDDAISIYKQACDVAPENTTLLFNLARAYYDSNKFNNAERMLRKALKVNPDFKDAKGLLAKISKKLRRPKKK